MSKPIGDIAGRQFGKLTAVAVTDRGGGSVKWLCECSCGNLAEVTAARLVSGHTRSCGCLVRNPVVTRPVPGTHKCRTKLKEYSVWRGMKQRCYNENCKEYKYYGDRGIQMCDRWLTFENFYQDMGPRPSDDHEIDRVDSNGNYELGNCRWLLGVMQARNTRKTVRLEYAGVTMAASDWADFFSTTRSAVVQSVTRIGVLKTFGRLVADKCVFFNGSVDTQASQSGRRSKYVCVDGVRYECPKLAEYFGIAKRTFTARMRRCGDEQTVRYFEGKTGRHLRDYVS